MKILVMGAGKMGSFFIDLLSFDHEVAVFERDPKRISPLTMRYVSLSLNC